jgi:hypothetical protein
MLERRRERTNVMPRNSSEKEGKKRGKPEAASLGGHM